MRVDNNGRKPKPRPAGPKGTTRLGGAGHIDPIEYARTALREEHARRLAEYHRQRGLT